MKRITTSTTIALLVGSIAVGVASLPARAQEYTKCSRENATIVGTPGDDVLEGTDDQDIILGLGGDDRIVAGGETYSEYYFDRICGGRGDDVLIGHQDQTDPPRYLETEAVVSGGPGNDRLIGGRQLDGGPGNDVLKGEEGRDLLYGGPGNDVINGGEPDDADFYAGDTAAFRKGPVKADLVDHKARGEGRDRLVGIENLVGTVKDDVLRGDEDRNLIDGGGGGDKLLGRGNDDTFAADGSELDPDIKTGLDVIDGGSGTDIISFQTRRGVEVNLAKGTVRSGGGLSEKLDGVENVVGSFKRDVLVGDDHANMLDGYDGRDVVRGGGGADDLLGGTGDDSLDGGEGDDSLDGGSGRDECRNGETSVRCE